MQLLMSEYVQWLQTIENLKPWDAKLKAQRVYFKQTGKCVPIYFIQSTDEIEEQRAIDKLEEKQRKMH